MRFAPLFAAALVVVIAAAEIYAYRAHRAPVAAAQASSDPLNGIPVFAPDGDAAGLVLLVSDAGGIGAADRALARKLLAENLVVLPIDLEVWRAALNASDGSCLYLGSAIEGLAKDAQRALGLESYFHPVVAGRGEGGALAFAAVADAPAATMAGGVWLGAPAALRTTLPVCEGAAASPAAGGGFTYDAAAVMPAPFVTIAPKAQAGEAEDEATVAVAAIAKADADALPVIDLPAVGETIAVAVFLSGDGGWRDLDKTIGEWLQAHGVHVLGVDSLRYFWSERPPTTMAADIARIIADAEPSPGLPIALLGYSFGADTLPFAFSHLDPAIAGEVDLIGLLAPGRATGFEISVGGWLGLDTGAEPVAPAIAALPSAKVLCVQGRSEGDSACADAAVADVATLVLEGGHHFDGDYAGLAARILAAIDQGPQAALAAPPGS